MTRQIVNDMAESNNISIINYPFKNIKACSIEHDRQLYIGINEKLLETTAERTTATIHELGHCMTGALYSADTPLYLQARCERRANVWAIKHFVPKETLQCYLRECYRMDEIAELLGVTEEFLWQAYYYYFR
ncbi:MAG: ImmA/IrrE family metallo-endopeptidase [Eubacterium sp.]|nr:ImmA/IrrE family metallo-endopeptidase [Eubacterium sp.]